MPMTADGVAKLIEECGELTQILGKKLAYWHTDEHPDGKGPISTRIMEEMGDVQAAMWFVTGQLGLDETAILRRSDQKFALFMKWQSMDDNNVDGIDRVE
jgi:hypothetical protein